MAIKYELVKLTETVGYLPGPQNIGVLIASDGVGCAIVDSGLTKDHGKAILKTLTAAGLEVRAIFNTHSHADHFGGNAYILENAGRHVEVYAPLVEAAYISHPELEPCGLFSGAWPPKSMFGHFLYAPASVVDNQIYAPPLHKREGLHIAELDRSIEVIDLKGHALGQAGYLLDGVLFVGDLVLSQAVIDKYKVLYCAHPAAHFETLAAMPGLVQEREVQIAVPAHVPHLAPTDFLALCEANRASFDAITAIIRPYLQDAAHTSEEVVQQVCNQLGLETKTAEAYYLLNTTILGLLSMLTNDGYELAIADNKPMWRKNS